MEPDDKARLLIHQRSLPWSLVADTISIIEKVLMHDIFYHFTAVPGPGVTLPSWKFRTQFNFLVWNINFHQ
jgi:hypothetical protein